MIINLSNFGGGGGGGSYVLPIASESTLGGVKIGNGVNIDSAGTISVSGSDVANYAMALKNIQEGEEDNFRVVNVGGWLYYVQDDKNTTENIFVKVLYNTDYVEINMEIDGQTDTDIVGFRDVTISIDENGDLFYINENDDEVYYDSATSEYHYGDFTFTWVNDGTYIDFPQQAQRIEVNIFTDNCEYWGLIAQDMLIANQDHLGLVKIGEGIDLAEDGTISVESQGGGIEVVSQLPASGTNGQIVILVDSATSSTTEYIWSDTPILFANISYITGNTKWYIRISDYEGLPNNKTLFAYNFGSKYFHIVSEDGGLHIYESDNDSGYTGSSYTAITQYQKYLFKNETFYWGTNELLVYASAFSTLKINFDAFYKTGWVKNIEYTIDDKGFFDDTKLMYFDGNRNQVVFSDRIYKAALKINGTTYSYIYAPSNGNLGPFFTPITSGQTGYVCVASSGNTAPTWKNPSTLLSKSTLYGTHSTFIVATEEWKLLDSSGNNTFDSGNFYIYNTCDFNEVTEIVNFNDATDDGEGGMTEPTKELKISANTDGSYDVFYGEFMDYQGGLYSYTASTHLETVFSNYEILSEDQTGFIVRMVLRTDGLYCYENNSGCGFVNNNHSTFTPGDSVTIGKMTVFVQYEYTPVVYLSQDEGI